MTDIPMTPKELLEFAKSLSEKIRSADTKTSLRIECDNNVGYHTHYFKIDGVFTKWFTSLTKGKLIIPASRVYSVKTIGHSPFPQEIYRNVTYEGTNVIIDLNPAMKFDFFSIEVGLKMDSEYVKNLVRARAPVETFEDRIHYHLSAQLKNPESLQLGFSDIEIEEFPVTARVHLTERINTHVPEYIKELVKVNSEMFDDRNPHRTPIEIKVLDRKRVKLLRKLGKATLEQKIQELAQLLTDTHFTSYLSTKEDFRLDRCERSVELFRAIGMFQLPKFMNVVSRTDLNLKKPAAKGDLIYHSKKFEEEIERIF